jgi:hypothetical protein
MEIEWAKDVSANEWGFQPMYCMAHKLYNSLGRPTCGGWNCPYSIKINVKLWSRFKTYRWPSYGLMTMCNIIRMCWFHKSVANCDKWPTYKGGQLDRFYCTCFGTDLPS